MTVQSYQLTQHSRKGKTAMLVAFCRFALKSHSSIIIATGEQASTLAMLRQYFPNHLMSLVEDWGIRLHDLRTKNGIENSHSEVGKASE